MIFNFQPNLIAGLDETNPTLRRRKINKALCLKADPIRPVDGDGNTALHYAVKCGHADSVLQLMRVGKVNPNVINIHGETPLHLVAELSDGEEAAEMAVALTKHKAMLTVGEDHQRHTPLMALCLTAHVHALARLIEAKKIWIGELVELGILGSDQIEAIRQVASKEKS